MGNSDSVPVVSQLKSFVQFASGDSAGALRTQQNFAYNNTFPVISQIASAGYAIGGDNEKALDLQKKFADDMQKVIDSIPVAGHIKGGVHYAMGQKEKGDESMKAASRSTGVVAGGVGGFFAGGPIGSVAGGITGGAVMDGIITGSDSAIHKEVKPYGYVKMGHEIIKAVEGKRNITTEDGFDMALVPISDGLAGYGAGRMAAKPLGLDVGGSKAVPVPVKGGGFNPISGGGVDVIVAAGDDGVVAGSRALLKPSGGVGQKIKVGAGVVDENANLNQMARGGNGNSLGLDNAALNNRANQLNPNHIPSGPGRPAGYQGLGTKADLNNHANQMNPNNALYKNVRDPSSRRI